MARRELYSRLGVNYDASADGIRQAYYSAARRLHPDKRPDDPTASAAFLRVTEAWEVLKDESKREVYDAFGIEGVRIYEAVGSKAPRAALPSLYDVSAASVLYAGLALLLAAQLWLASLRSEGRALPWAVVLAPTLQ